VPCLRSILIYLSCFFVLEFLQGSQTEFWVRVSTLRVASVVMHHGGKDKYLLKLCYFLGRN
jgi:hypothetical protein